MGHSAERRSDGGGGVRLRHYVITRLNARHTEKKNLDPTWLRRRVDLFEKYAAFSIGRQSVKDFEWIVWVDMDTPDGFAGRISEITTAAGGRIVWDRERFASDSITDMFYWWDEPAPEWVMTTRLDSDDMLSGDFVELVQSEFVLSSGTATDFEIELISGGLYDEATGKLLQAEGGGRRFVSYAYNTKQGIYDIRNCYGVVSPRDKVRKIRATTRTAWLKVFHDQNCVSRLDYGRLAGMSDEVTRDRFGVCLGSLEMVK